MCETHILFDKFIINQKYYNFFSLFSPFSFNSLNSCSDISFFRVRHFGYYNIIIICCFLILVIFYRLFILLLKIFWSEGIWIEFIIEFGITFWHVLLIFLVGHLLYSVKVSFQVDFLSVSESSFWVELLFGDDIIADHMMCDFASEFVAKIWQSLGQNFRCCSSYTLVLFLFFLFGFFFLNLFDFVFDSIQSI